MSKSGRATQKGGSTASAFTGSHTCFQELSIDCFGPWEPAKDGVQYVLAACDGLSCFVFCEPAPDTEAMSAARFIHRLCRRFGFLEAFRWDNRGQFDNH